MEITTDNFNEIINGGKPVVVDFWATWCGPCRMVAPIIEELATEFEGQVVVGKVDVEEQDDLAAQFGIRSIPTLLFFKDGKLVDRSVGAVPKQVLVDKIDAML